MAHYTQIVALRVPQPQDEPLRVTCPALEQDLTGIVQTVIRSIQPGYVEFAKMGLLRAIGASRAQVVYLVLAEASLMGVFGSILGVIFGPFALFALYVMPKGHVAHYAHAKKADPRDDLYEVHRKKH